LSPAHKHMRNTAAVIMATIRASSDCWPVEMTGVGVSVGVGGGPYFTIGVTGTPYIGWTTWDRAPAEKVLTIAIAATMGDIILTVPDLICLLKSSINGIDNNNAIQYINFNAHALSHSSSICTWHMEGISEPKSQRCMLLPRQNSHHLQWIQGPRCFHSRFRIMR